MTQHLPPDGLGYTTNPMRVGAPLPTDMMAIAPPQPGAVMAELVRAEVELMYALARHRQAWNAMRKYKEIQDARAIDQRFENFLDSDPTWKIKTGDVAWWRGEVNAQAAAVLALAKMAGVSESLDGWAETTNHKDLASGQRTFIRGR